MTAKKNPGDFTAVQRDVAAKQATEEKDLRQQELTMATAAKARALTDEVIDLTDGTLEDVTPAPVVVPDDDADEPELDPSSDLNDASKDAIAATEVVLASEKSITIRVNTEIKDMTYGAGTYYTFLIGPKYKVPVALANYLDALGYVWH